MRAIIISLLFISHLTIMQAQETIKFTVIGGYQFAEGYALHQEQPFVFAQAGQLTGAWHWEFDNGQQGNTHVNGATANRVLGGTQNELFGTMQVNMFELEGSAPGQDLLFMAYTATHFEVEGSQVSIRVNGEFTGGTGRYAGARGFLTVTSVNGFFADGRGELWLGITETATEAQVEDWVLRYFKSTQSNDAEQWAANFAEGAVVDDPFGAEQPGSHAEIVARGEAFMASFESAGLYPEWIFVKGLTATAKWTGRAITKEGKEATFEGINVYEWHPNGTIKKLTGYWDPEQMVIK